MAFARYGPMLDRSLRSRGWRGKWGSGVKEAIGFSSEGLADDDAFVRYRRLYAQGADVVRLDGPFRARVTGWR